MRDAFVYCCGMVPICAVLGSTSEDSATTNSGSASDGRRVAPRASPSTLPSAAVAPSGLARRPAARGAFLGCARHGPHCLWRCGSTARERVGAPDGATGPPGQYGEPLVVHPGPPPHAVSLPPAAASLNTTLPLFVFKRQFGIHPP